MLPSELFRRQVYTTFWFEHVAPTHLLDVLPVDNLLFETDFPHVTGLYGNIEETIAASLGHVPDPVRRKLLWENAAGLYRIDAPTEADVARMAAAGTGTGPGAGAGARAAPGRGPGAGAAAGAGA
jgi:hypothetical protein